eukprot:scaffold1334_cov123-Cylindrotheca_fusiformis.AAC.1
MALQPIVNPYAKKKVPLPVHTSTTSTIHHAVATAAVTPAAKKMHKMVVTPGSSSSKEVMSNEEPSKNPVKKEVPVVKMKQEQEQPPALITPKKESNHTLAAKKKNSLKQQLKQEIALLKKRKTLQRLQYEAEQRRLQQEKEKQARLKQQQELQRERERIREEKHRQKMELLQQKEQQRLLKQQERERKLEEKKKKEEERKQREHEAYQRFLWNQQQQQQQQQQRFYQQQHYVQHWQGGGMLPYNTLPTMYALPPPPVGAAPTSVAPSLTNIPGFTNANSASTSTTGKVPSKDAPLHPPTPLPNVQSMNGASTSAPPAPHSTIATPEVAGAQPPSFHPTSSISNATPGAVVSSSNEVNEPVHSVQSMTDASIATSPAANSTAEETGAPPPSSHPTSSSSDAAPATVGSSNDTMDAPSVHNPTKSSPIAPVPANMDSHDATATSKQSAKADPKDANAPVLPTMNSTELIVDGPGNTVPANADSNTATNSQHHSVMPSSNITNLDNASAPVPTTRATAVAAGTVNCRPPLPTFPNPAVPSTTTISTAHVPPPMIYPQYQPLPANNNYNMMMRMRMMNNSSSSMGQAQQAAHPFAMGPPSAAMPPLAYHHHHPMNPGTPFYAPPLSNTMGWQHPPRWPPPTWRSRLPTTKRKRKQLLPSILWDPLQAKSPFSHYQLIAVELVRPVNETSFGVSLKLFEQSILVDPEVVAAQLKQKPAPFADGTDPKALVKPSSDPIAATSISYCGVADQGAKPNSDSNQEETPMVEPMEVDSSDKTAAKEPGSNNENKEPRDQAHVVPKVEMEATRSEVTTMMNPQEPSDAANNTQVSVTSSPKKNKTMATEETGTDRLEDSKPSNGLVKTDPSALVAPRPSTTIDTQQDASASSSSSSAMMNEASRPTPIIAPPPTPNLISSTHQAVSPTNVSPNVHNKAETVTHKERSSQQEPNSIVMNHNAASPTVLVATNTEPNTKPSMGAVVVEGSSKPDAIVSSTPLGSSNVDSSSIAPTSGPTSTATSTAATIAANINGTEASKPRKQRRRRVMYSVMLVLDAEKQNKFREILGYKEGELLLQPGDIIVSIGGVDIAGMPFDRACATFASKAETVDGTKICTKLMVARRPKPVVPPAAVKVSNRVPKATNIKKSQPVASAPRPVLTVDDRSEFQGNELAVLADCVIRAIHKPSRMLGQPLSLDNTCLDTMSTLCRRLATLKQHFKYDGNITLPFRSISTLQSKWMERTRSVESDFRTKHQVKWARAIESEGGSVGVTFASDAERSALRHMPRPVKGCRCKRDDHEYLHDPKCLLYRDICKLVPDEVLSGLWKTDEKVSKKKDVGLNVVEKGFKDRMMRLKKTAEMEEAEARFVAHMEDIQVKQCKKAVFAPTALASMVLSTVFELQREFPVSYVPEDDSDEDEEEEEDVPLAMMVDGKRNSPASSEQPKRKRRKRMPQPNKLISFRYLLRMFQHISKVWGHVYREPSHEDYAWYVKLCLSQIF